ncbi:glycosyltransferase [Bradyrhizobium sp. CB1650]|uniref:glycosyltransferase family 2 protein n=1 Tax=Bradyrhizobium sp. CB1650 TaxID=3039153 RepID=UPI0024352117|nr:glycosyltransferase family 2 protein [Bradyrhizobium sp. CB1650]WGD54932.1 glycosyltransferase [Bradyrhizobium sp. CB1650]
MATILELTAIGLVLVTLALVIQAGAVLFFRDRPLPVSSRRPSIAVLIPAHDEETDIEATVHRIREDLSPGDRLLVIADNCADRTALLAAQSGADVVIRNDRDRPGKGFALAAGLRHIAGMPPEIVVFVDADCQTSPRCIELLARACDAAKGPVQGLDLMVADPRNPASARLRLAEFAWRIKNDLRPSGYARLGLPCHLLGTGMAMPWGLIRPHLFATGHLAEDMLFGLELALIGRPPRFFRAARVTSYFPDSQRGQTQQKERWVQGHLGLIISHLPRLTYRGLLRREVGLLALAADIAVPPLGLLALANMLLLSACVAYMALVGNTVPVGLVALANCLFVFALATAWHLCGRDLIGLDEVKELPRQVLMVIRPLMTLARGQRTPWIRAERTGQPHPPH